MIDLGDYKKSKPWLADFWIESNLILPDGEPELKITLADCEVSFRNAGEGAKANESLSGQILLLAEDIAAAEELAKERMREILNILSFSTNGSFRISRPRFVMDWSLDDLEAREQYAYGSDDTEHRWPHFALSNLKTLAELYSLPSSRKLHAPLRWFAAGIRARVGEDQFQFFWLVLELIAEITKPTGKVTDKCQRCRSDLFCPSCNEVSEHRPFPKQAIEALLTKLKVSQEIQRGLFAVRNGIVHGRTRSEIEEEVRVQQQQPDWNLALAIDFVWRTAFMAIINALGVPHSRVDRLTFSSPDSIVSRTFTFKGHVWIGLKGKELKLENVVVPEVDVIYSNDQGQTIDPLTGAPLADQRG